MNIRNRIVTVLFTLLTVCPVAFASSPVRAQGFAPSIPSPQIDGFDVGRQGGGTQAVSYEAEPGFRMGDKARAINATLVRNQSTLMAGGRCFLLGHHRPQPYVCQRTDCVCFRE